MSLMKWISLIVEGFKSMEYNFFTSTPNEFTLKVVDPFKQRVDELIDLIKREKLRSAAGP